MEIQYRDSGRLEVLIPNVDRLLSDFLQQMNPLLSTFLDTGKLYTNITICRADLISNILSKGVQMITSTQQNQASTYLIMTTISTFFSGVTATTLQFTYAQTTAVIDNIVNALLFSSLIFSIASAVNSLLIMSWKRSFMYAVPFLGLR